MARPSPVMRTASLRSIGFDIGVTTKAYFLYAFDLIELNGDDLRGDPLEGRKETLVMILAKAGSGIRFNEHLKGDGETVFHHACKLLPHRHSCCEQRAHNTTLIPAARLEPDCHDREVSQPLDERGPATGVIRHRTALLLGQHHDVQTIFRHVDSAKREHLRIPSLLMRARAHATVRVWKKRLELQAHSRIRIRSACGLPVAT